MGLCFELTRLQTLELPPTPQALFSSLQLQGFLSSQVVMESSTQQLECFVSS